MSHYLASGDKAIRFPSRKAMRKALQTALCADGEHERCNGKVSQGYPETGIREYPCSCVCHAPSRLA